MKKKKGFTLVELLAIIAIIGVIGVIATYAVVNMTDNSKTAINNVSIENIRKMSQRYVNEFENEIIWAKELEADGTEKDTNYTCVSVQMLINKGYFKGNIEIEEKSTNTKINNNTFIKVTRDKNTYVISDTIGINSDECKSLAPYVTLVASDGIESGNWHKENFTLETNITDTAATNLTYYLDDNTNPTTEQKSITITKNETGKKYYSKVCTAIGFCGNTAEYEVKIDNTKPIIEEFTKSKEGYAPSLDLTATFRDDDSGLAGYKITQTSTYQDSGWTSVSGTSSTEGTLNITESGTWYVWVKDVAGNYASEAIEVDNKDHTKPVIESFTKSTSDYASSITLTAKFKDSESGLKRYQITTKSTYPTSGWTTVSGTSSVTKTLTISQNTTWYVWVEDQSGNYNYRTIKIDNIGTIKTATFSTGEQYNDPYSGTYTLNNAKKVLSVSVNTGSVSSYSLSGTTLYYTVTGGYEYSESYTGTCTTSATRTSASTKKTCTCPKGGTLDGTTCSSYISKSGTGTTKFSICCNNGSSWECGSSGTNNVVCGAGETKGYSCEEPVFSSTCTSTFYVTVSCKGWCTAPSYSATCTTSYYCSSGTKVGTSCYSCSKGSLNSNNRCSYSCTQYYDYYYYTITVEYLV